ncbi:MAG: ATP-binding protein [Actinomycetota bacterium]
MITCPRCSHQNEADARFCSNCGLSLLETDTREERRVVTILFADLVGFTAFSDSRDPEDVKRIIDRAFEGLAEIVTIYGGRVDKILGDEIMAVFGAPQAHEDDPERAVRCALEMQRSLQTFAETLQSERGLTMSMRVGINTGEVVTGAIGGGSAYTVVGDAVNVASRLVKEAEPGAILVGATTRAASERAIEFGQPVSLQIRGKPEPVLGSHALSERTAAAGPRARDTSPLVGRAPELQVLDAISEIVTRDRRPAVITILGDAGMGKTRLVAEFTKRLEGWRVLWGRSLPYGTASPAFALEEMTRALFDVSVTDDVQTARKKISEKLAAVGMAAETDRINALTGLREQGAKRAMGPAPAGPASSGVSSRSDLASAIGLFETLAGMQERGLALVFQELHWAEQDLIDFVGELVEHASNVPLLVLALGRPEMRDRTRAWPARSGNTMLQLLPLSREASAELLDALAGGRLHPSVIQNVLDRASGNPFFLEEFVRLSLEAGARGGAAVPVSVQALVAARLDMLDPAVRRVAQDAAVIGEQFWPEAIAAMGDSVGEDAVRAAIATLIDRELIEPSAHPTLPGRDEYGFKQSIVREVAYNALPKQTRAQRHASVGGWLEEIARSLDTREFVDLIAYHYEKAAVSAREVGAASEEFGAKAREYLERAGDESIGVDAAYAAALFYERALAFARDPVDALHLRVHLGEAFVGSWNPVKAESHLQQALKDARAVGDRKLEGKTLRLLGDLERMRGNLDDARTHLEHALVIAREQNDATEEAEGLRSHGLTDLLGGRVPSSPLWFRQALARYRDLGDRRGQAWCLQNLGWANLLLGRLDEALTMLDEGAVVFGELSDLEGVGWCLGLRSWVLLFQGKLDEADDLAKQLIEFASSAEANPIGMGGMGVEIERVLRAIVATNRLRFSEAILLATASFASFEEVDSHWGLAMARFPIGVSQLARRELRAARETIEEGKLHADESGDPLLKGLMRSMLAYLEFDVGNLDKAEQLGSEGLELARSSGVEVHSETAVAWLHAEILRSKGDLNGALRVLEPVMDSERFTLIPWARAVALYADVLRERGEPEKGVQFARKALDAAGARLMDGVWARRTLVASLLDAGQIKEALDEADLALEVLSESEWTDETIRMHALRARALDELSRHDEAAEAYDRARSLLADFGPDADLGSLESLLQTLD